MNEPEHPHFVLSDGMYCHVLPEGFIVSKKNLPEERPVQKDSPDAMAILFLSAGIAIATFFIAMCVITGFYVVVAMLGALDLLMIYSLWRTIGYSHTNFIPRADIVGLKYNRRSFGYDSFIVYYTGKNGKACKRRYVIYDSQECLDNALGVMRAEGLLK
ncbi:MAG TPA: hypothetical protein VK826_08645 [Bacteroidia bacterium]|nr:hypothetical protein [Bacteroidia bacterium]